MLLLAGALLREYSKLLSTTFHPCLINEQWENFKVYIQRAFGEI